MRIFNKADTKLRRNFLTGLTLVEVLIAALVLGLLFMGVMEILNSSDMTWNIDMGLVDMQQQTRHAMAGMLAEIRQANSVIVGTSILTFSTPWAASGDIVYSLVSGQIIRTYNGETKVLANNISSLDFSQPVSGTVEIQLQAQKIIRGRVITFPVGGSEKLIERVKLRN